VQPPPHKTQPGLIGKESNDRKVLEYVPDPNLKCRQHHHIPDREETPHIAIGKIGGIYQDQPGDRELNQDRSGPVPRSAWMTQAIPRDPSITMEKPIQEPTTTKMQPTEIDVVGRVDQSVWKSQAKPTSPSTVMIDRNHPTQEFKDHRHKMNEQEQYQQKDILFHNPGVTKPPDLHQDKNRN